MLLDVVEDDVLGLAEGDAAGEGLQEAGRGVHVPDDLGHLGDRLGRGLDHDVDALVQDVELAVGDQCGYLDERVVAQVESRHLAVDPDQPLVHGLTLRP